MITPATQVTEALSRAMWETPVLMDAQKTVTGGDALIAAMIAQGMHPEQAAVIAQAVMVRMAKAALQAVYPALAEVGWQAVPVEPTEKMEIAADDAFNERDRDRGDASAEYAEMLKAAPLPPGAEPQPVVN